jgi:CheY-like chemotaxis protein
MGTERRRPRVLLVDDDRPNRVTVERVFRGRYDITSAPSAAVALELLATAEFDVALLDYSMPQINGLELARRVRESRPDLPCVIVTGYGDLDLLEDAKASGLILDVVTKPWQPSDIDHAVERALRLRAAVPP